MKVAAIGEAMIELSMDGDHAAVGVAGDTLNTAIYLKRTAPAIQVDYVPAWAKSLFPGRSETLLPPSVLMLMRSNMTSTERPAFMPSRQTRAESGRSPIGAISLLHGRCFRQRRGQTLAR